MSNARLPSRTSRTRLASDVVSPSFETASDSVSTQNASALSARGRDEGQSKVKGFDGVGAEPVVYCL